MRCVQLYTAVSDNNFLVRDLWASMEPLEWRVPQGPKVRRVNLGAWGKATNSCQGRKSLPGLTITIDFVIWFVREAIP